MPFESLERILSLPQLAIASGQFGNFAGVNVYGYNGSIGTSEQTVWPHTGVYSFPATTSTMTVSSDDANDAAAGTGARTVEIMGLDANHQVVFEAVTLNGLTEVTTTNAFLRIQSLEVIDAGSGGENAGIIYIGTGTVTSGVPANVFGLIEKTDNLSHHSFWTVPAGITAYIPNYLVTSYGTAASVAEIRFRVRKNGFFFRTIHRFKVTRGSTPGMFFVPLRLEEKTDFQVLASADTGNIDVGAIINVVVNENEAAS